MASKQERLAKLYESEAELEAQIFGAEQEEQVLDDSQVVAPEESAKVKVELTDDIFDKVTAPEDTTMKPTGDLAQLRKDYADLQHRWNRFKGSTDGTIFELRTKVKNLSEALVAAREEISGLKSQIATKDTEDSIFTQDVIDVLGEETVDAIKASTSDTKRQLEEIRRELAKQETERLQKEAATAQADNERDFMARLREYVPDLDQMNGDPGFNEWLRQPDSYGIERLQTLREDQKRYDARRVSEFFIEYKRVQTERDKKIVKDSVQDHIGPTGKKTGESNTYKDPANQGTIRQSEINEFRRDVQRGKYKYDGVKAEAFEARVWKAMSEDKIIFDEEPI